jgi:hypothetical protein
MKELDLVSFDEEIKQLMCLAYSSNAINEIKGRK